MSLEKVESPLKELLSICFSLLWQHYDNNSAINGATGTFSVMKAMRVTPLNNTPLCSSQYSIVIRTIKQIKNHKLQSREKSKWEKLMKLGLTDKLF